MVHVEAPVSRRAAVVEVVSPSGRSRLALEGNSWFLWDRWMRRPVRTGRFGTLPAVRSLSLADDGTTLVLEGDDGDAVLFDLQSSAVRRRNIRPLDQTYGRPATTGSEWLVPTRNTADRSIRFWLRVGAGVAALLAVLGWLPGAVLAVALATLRTPGRFRLHLSVSVGGSRHG